MENKALQISEFQAEVQRHKTCVAICFRIQLIERQWLTEQLLRRKKLSSFDSMYYDEFLIWLKCTNAKERG